MIVKKQELIAVMDAIKPGLSKKDITRQLQDFFFTGKEIATYNEKISVLHPYETDFKVSVSSEWLYKQVSLFPQDEMEIIHEGNEIKIRGENSEIDVTIIEDKYSEHLAAVHDDIANEAFAWKKIPSDFVKGVQLCMFSMGKDLSANNLSAFMRIHGDKIHSTDGWSRMSEYLMDEGVDDIMYIPGYIISEFLKYNFMQYKVTDNWQHFKSDKDVVFSIKKMASGDYVDVNDMVNEPLDGPRLIMPTNLKQYILSAEVATEDIQAVSDREVIVNMSVDKMTISWTSVGGYGKVKHTLPMAYKGKEYEFRINPSLMKEILGKTQFMHVDNVKFKAVFSFEKFKHLLMLVQSW
jgi:hypothetical protein